MSTVTETTMGAAMRRAGILSPSARLDGEIAEARDVGDGDFEIAAASLTQRVMADGRLLWELWGRFPKMDRNEAIRAAVRGPAKIAGRVGHIAVVTQHRDAPIPGEPNDGGKGHRSSDAHSMIARPAVMPKQNPPRVPLSVISEVAADKARSLLDTLSVNGKPIRQATAGECLAVADNKLTQGRDLTRAGRLLQALAHGFPPNAVMGDVLTPEEAERRRKLVEASHG